MWLSGGADFDVNPKVLEAAEQSSGELRLVAMVEVIGTEVAIRDLVRPRRGPPAGR